MPSVALPIQKSKEEPAPSTQEQEKGKFRVNDIFPYFSEETLKLIKEAGVLAKEKGVTYLTPWHLLGTLIKKDEIALKIGKDFQTKISDEIIKKLPTLKNIKYSGTIFFSPETLKVFIAAYIISRQQSANSVNDLHLLSALSVYPEMQDLFEYVNLGGESISATYMPESLGAYAIDLSGQIKTGEKNYTERTIELESVMRILARGTKNHVILLGEEGVGKSVMGRAIAQYLLDSKIPGFSGIRVISIDLGSLFSLTAGGLGAQNIVGEIASLGRIILFLHNANLLNTTVQLSRLVGFLQDLEKNGSVSFIMPATPAFYKEFISVNPYFSTNFEVVKIEELSAGNTEQVVAEEIKRIEKLYKVNVQEQVTKEVVFLSKRYLPGSLPQKAISLLEEAATSVSLKKGTVVTVDDVRTVVSQKTGIPLNSLTESEMEKLRNLEILLGRRVIGQSEAIKKVSESLRRARAGLKDPKKPIGSFLFLGPTGVGKTELAKTLARIFFNDEKSFLRFDMSEYAESHTAQRLIGSPPGYVGYEEGGQLTNKVMEHPYSLILFDEIEKAHPRVFDLFLQILDDGRLTDSQGRTVDFINTLIIFTSNIASQEIFASSANLIKPDFDRKAFLDSVIMPIVRQYFRPELINRFDDVILFNPLSKENLMEIAKLKIESVKERLKGKRITLEISDAKLKELVEDSYDPSFGARPLERMIRDRIENVIAQKVISGGIKEGGKIEW